jgi:hypothetical protein
VQAIQSFDASIRSLVGREHSRVRETKVAALRRP